jgi:carbamoyltransferase
LGIFYTCITDFLGFKPHDEYKIMGLSSYGRPKYKKEILKVIHPFPNGKIKIDTSYFRFHITRGFTLEPYFSQKFMMLFGNPRDADQKISQYHKDIAASAQAVFEDCSFHQLNHLFKITNCTNLCIAGGCGLNGVMVGKIINNTGFKHVYLPPVSGDSGLSLGGALYIWHTILKNPRKISFFKPNIGSKYTDQEIEVYLKITKIKFKRYKKVIKKTVDLLVEGKIVGWFQDRMEYGPRALGFRSILANPTLFDMKDKINKYVKFREDFRPFAPSVIEEKALNFFDYNDNVPYMTYVCKVKETYKKKLPAITHVDGSARIHTVNKKNNPLFWEIIYEFGKRTGFPILLNTSFNGKGEPIVEHPLQAIRCFYSTGMDVLVIGNFIIEK